MKISDISYYLFESYKDAKAKFSQEESEDIVKKYLETFKQLTKKGKASGQEKDIGYWIKQGWEPFKQFVDSKQQEKTKGEVKRAKKKESIIAHDDEEVMVVIPLSKDASCFYGKNTKWCTAATESDNHFIEYFYINKIILFYLFMKGSGKKYAAAYSKEVNSFEYFDELDTSMSQKSFEKITGIENDQLLNWYNEYKNNIEKAMDLNNLSEEDQLEAVKENGLAIKYIDNPSEAVQLEAVKKYGRAIKYINNPSEALQLEAVKRHSRAIRLIDNPSEAVQLKAVKENGLAIKYIDNPSEALQLEAVKQNGLTIKYIDNPSEEVQLEAIKEDGYAIQFIDNPSEALQLEAVKKYGRTIRFIDNPSEALQLEAVKQNGYAIQLIDNPSEAVKLEAVKQNGFAIRLIDNPSEKAKQLHQELWGDE